MQLLRVTVPSLHGLCIAAAIIIMMFYAFYYSSEKKYDASTLMYIAPAAIFFGFAGARLIYVIICDQEYVDAADKWKLTDGGYSLFGAAAGVVFAVVLYWLLTKRRAKLLPVFDTLSASAPLAIAVGRLGSVFSESCYGEAVGSDGLKFFPISIFSKTDMEFHYAVFFYEALWCVLVFFLIRLAEKKLNRRGVATYMFAVLYCAARSVLESMRIDSMYIFFVRFSQVIAIFTVIGAFIWMSVKLVRKTKFKPLYIISYVVFTASFVIAFFSEFYMYSSSKVWNTVKILLCCIVMAATALYIGLYYLYVTKKKKKRIKASQDKTRQFNRVVPAKENKDS